MRPTLVCITSHNRREHSYCVLKLSLSPGAAAAAAEVADVVGHLTLMTRANAVAAVAAAGCFSPHAS